MKKLDRKFIFVLLLLSLSGFVSWNYYFKVYRQEDQVNIHLFPTSVGDWISEEIPITEDDYAILETRNAFTRKYKTPEGQSVNLFIVYSESNRKVSHPPEICYLGSGISVIDNTHSLITSEDQKEVIKANRLLLEHGRFHQVAYYWFKVGDTFVSNYWKQQVMIVFNTLLGRPSSSALIRVSTTIRDHDIAKADEGVQSFTRGIIPHLYNFLP